MERMEPRSETVGGGDARRAFRRKMELEALSKASDKTILSNVMLVALVALSAAASLFGVTLTVGAIRDVTVLAVIMYVMTSMVYRNRYERGKLRGKRDEEYRAALAAYREARAAIDTRGLAGRMPAFCRAYKLRELRDFRSDLLLDIGMAYEVYEAKYMRLSDRQVMRSRLLPHEKKTILQCNHAKPLRLSPGMVLNENGGAHRHALLGQSGRERECRDKRKQLIQRGIWVVFGGMVGFSFAVDLSPENWLRWAVRMAPVAMAIIFGDDDGFVNITVTETQFKRGQVAVLRLFEAQVAAEEAAVADTEAAASVVAAGGSKGAG